MKTTQLKTVLTIAGSDPSGGAGIQADLKTFAAHGVYGMSVITALTAQNTMGVYGISEVSPAFVAKQLDAIFTDIRPDAVKIGMVSSGEIAEVIVEKLLEYHAVNIVVDPVMVSTSGAKLLSDSAMEVMKTKLIPIAHVMTPNLMEAEVLTGMRIRSGEEMACAAEVLAQHTKKAVLIKGGHFQDTSDDLLLSYGEFCWFYGARIPNPNTHGTGCTLSSAIASHLALGYDLKESVRKSKDYVTGAIRAGLDLGSGRGPLNHMWQK